MIDSAAPSTNITTPLDQHGWSFRHLQRPDTVLRWHRELLRRRHAAVSRPKRPGRPRTIRSIRMLVLRLAKENPSWGYRRIHGELLVRGLTVAASTVWQILTDAGIGPVPQRTSSTWAQFLRSQAEVLLACDFFETVTLTGARLRETWVAVPDDQHGAVGLTTGTARRPDDASGGVRHQLPGQQASSRDTSSGRRVYLRWLVVPRSHSRVDASSSGTSPAA
jgi:hypothetical protein